MNAPFIFIGTHKIKPGKCEAFKQTREGRLAAPLSSVSSYSPSFNAQVE